MAEWSKNQTLQAIAGGGELLSGQIARGILASKPDDAEELYWQQVRNNNRAFLNNYDFDSLEGEFSTFKAADTNLDKYDVVGGSLGKQIGQIFSNAAQGAGQGASIGTAIYPGIGTAIGAAAGFVGDLISSSVGVGVKNARGAKTARKLNLAGETANKQAMKNLEGSIDMVNMGTKNQALLNLAAYGGDLNTSDYFSNGVRFITEGGSHEQNPLGGVLQGFAMDGLPNFVEEDEVVFNDYVYSKRLDVPEKDKETLGLKKDKKYTYAEAAEEIQKESEERPNDPLSKKGLEVMMSRLQNSQEELKQKKDAAKFMREFNKLSPEEQLGVASMMSGGQFACGGKLGHKHAGTELWDSSSLVYPSPVFGIDGLSLDKDYTLSINPETGNKVGGIAFATPDFAVQDVAAKQLYPTVTLETPDILNGYTRDSSINKGSKKSPEYGSLAQYLRAVPALGAVGSAIASLFDTPNYTNIARAENLMNRVPRVSARPIGEKLTYQPIDINYLFNRQNNMNLGARRIAQELSGGNKTAAAQMGAISNINNQVSAGELLLKAIEANKQQKERVVGFNRETSKYNSTQGLQADAINQELAKAKAEFFLKTGQLRDAELARVQANQSTQITNAMNQIGNLGTDMLNREMAAAMAESYGVPYNPYMQDLLYGNYYPFGKKVACGGKLNTKKGGKHA